MNADIKARPDRWCISYNQLLQVEEMARKVFGEADYEQKTMRDVCNRIVVPKCNETGTSYALSLNPTGLDIGAYVAHSWDGEFVEFVESIRLAFQAKARKPNLWICAFSLQQSDDDVVIEHQIGTKEAPLTETPFAKAMKEAPFFCVVRNSHTDLFTRIWCVCELFFAKQFGLFPDKTFVSGPGDFADLKSSCVDAQSTRKADKIRILRELLKSPGDAELVDDIMEEFRTQKAPVWNREDRKKQKKPAMRSQEEVQARFGPLLRREGKIFRKTVTAFIRKAVKGEHITTDIAGVLESETTVLSDDFWVVCSAKSCYECYAITNVSFHDNYKIETAKPIPATGAHSLQLAKLRQAGFMEYESRRRVWAREVDQQDMEFLLEAQKLDPEDSKTRDHAMCIAPWGTPMRVEKGDFLVTRYPQADDGINRIERSVFLYTYVEDTGDEGRTWLSALFPSNSQAATVGAVAAGTILAVLLAVRSGRPTKMP